MRSTESSRLVVCRRSSTCSRCGVFAFFVRPPGCSLLLLSVSFAVKTVGLFQALAGGKRSRPPSLWSFPLLRNGPTGEIDAIGRQGRDTNTDHHRTVGNSFYCKALVRSVVRFRHESSDRSVDSSIHGYRIVPCPPTLQS